MLRRNTLYAGLAFLFVASAATIVGCNSSVDAANTDSTKPTERKTVFEPYTLYWGGDSLRKRIEVSFTAIETYEDGTWVKGYTPEKPGKMVWLNVSKLTWVHKRPTESAVANEELHKKLKQANAAIENGNREKALAVFELPDHFMKALEQQSENGRAWKQFKFNIKYAWNIGFKKASDSERYMLFDPSKAVKSRAYFVKKDGSWTHDPW